MRTPPDMSTPTDAPDPHALAADVLDAAQDPFALFDAWLADADRSEPFDPTAMALATADAEGTPNVRMLLLKGHGPDGFVFYTNAESVKGGELAANPKAAMCFHWKSLGRQIRIRGEIVPATEAEADAYFASRARDSRLGARASQQSRPLASRALLEDAIKGEIERAGTGEIVRPPYWRGYRLVPSEIEFWINRPHRLHDRMRFTRQSPSQPWVKNRLYP